MAKSFSVTSDLDSEEKLQISDVLKQYTEKYILTIRCFDDVKICDKVVLVLRGSLSLIFTI